TESFIKNRSSQSLGLKEERETSAVISMRGYDNNVLNPIETGQWVRIGPRGRELSNYSEAQKLMALEYLVARITSINVASEMLMSEYSEFLYRNDLERVSLAKNYGYRLWSGDLDDGEIKRRHDYMLEYVRRSETTLLIETDKFNRKMRERGEVISATKWSDS